MNAGADFMARWKAHTAARSERLKREAADSENTAPTREEVDSQMLRDFDATEAAAINSGRGA